MWPNPAHDVLHYETPFTVTRLAIADMFGRTWIQENGSMKSSGQLDVQSLPAGMYILRLGLQNGTVVTKAWVKQ